MVGPKVVKMVKNVEKWSISNNKSRQLIAKHSVKMMKKRKQRENTANCRELHCVFRSFWIVFHFYFVKNASVFYLKSRKMKIKKADWKRKHELNGGKLGKR